ncbi:MAG: amidohydrolase [Acidobacteriota bacterium]
MRKYVGLARLLWPVCVAALFISAQRPPKKPAQTRPRKPPAQKPAPAPPPADLLIVNGKVFTSVAGAPFAQAVAIRGDRIVEVGATAELQKYSGPQTRLIDAAGRVVVPGFNDAHMHPEVPVPGYRLPQGNNPMPDPTFKEIEKLVADAAGSQPKGTWIFGTIGATVIDDAEATRFALDGVAKDHPVLLRAWTGHGTFFNTAAMRVLGISETEPDPVGGFYGRIKKGKSDRTLSGFAHEYAEYRIARKLHDGLTDQQIQDAFRKNADEALSYGITSLQAMMIDSDADRVAQALRGANLPVRLRLIRFPLIDPATWQPAPDAAPPTPNTMLSVWGTKWIVDGTPIERLAFFKEAYADRARWKGQPNFKDSSLGTMLFKALDSKDQLMFHAVGDAAIEQVFSAMTGAGSPLRWQSRRVRIEHADGLIGDLPDRAAKLGVIVVQNPAHLALQRVFPARLGQARAAIIQPMKSLVSAGIPLAIGSDGPLNTGMNLMFAVTHPDDNKEALSREEAMRAYTWGSAYAQFADQEKGTLAPGMLADVAILSQDVFTVPPDALPNTTALTTIVGGKVVYETK